MPEIVTLNPSKNSGGRGRFPILTDTSGPNLPLESFYSPKYDAGYRQGINQQYNRANNQGWLEQLGYGLLSRTASIGTKSLAALGSVGTALSIPFTENTIDDIWNNPLTQWMNSIDEDLGEVFPVFQSQKYEEGNLLQKMGTTSFWATDFMDGAAFAASAFIPGKLLGAGLNKLGNVVKSADVGAGLLSKLAQIDPHKANLVLSTAYNTVAEAGAEAYQTQKELESIYLSQGSTPEEAKAKASEAAREVFGANMAILAIPNYIQNSFFHGAWSKKVNAIRKAAIESEGAASAQKFLGSKWQDIVGGIASEGFWEENAQTAVQQYERALANNHLITDSGFLAEVADNMYSNMKGFAKSVLPGTYDITPEETEGALSIALGGILGGMFGTASTMTEAKNIRKAVEAENKLFTTFKTEVAPAATTLLRQNVSAIHKTNGTKVVKDGDNDVEVPNYVLDENGKAQIDEHALNAIVTNGLRNKFFWDAETLAAMNNNQTMGEFNKELALAAYAYELGTNAKLYSKENVLAALDKVSKTAQAEADELGVNTLARENMDVVAKYLDIIEATTNKYQTAKAAKDPQEIGFRNFLTQTDIYLQAKLNAINRIRTSHENMTPKLAESLNLLETDTLEHMRFIQEDQKAVRSIYQDLVRDPLVLKSQIEELQNKKNKSEDEYAKLRELRYLAGENNYINGNFAYLGTGAAQNPIGLQSSRMVKTVPGAKDDLQFNIGESWASLKKAQQHLNSVVPEIEAAEKEFNKINTAQNSDELSKTSAQIIEGLEAKKAEATEVLQQAKEHSEAFTVINNIDEFLDDSLGDHIARAGGDVESVIDVLSKYVNVTADTPFTPELFNQLSSAITDVIESMGPEVQRANQELAVLDSRIDRVRNYEDRINAKASKYSEYLNSPNREEFLKRAFYETQIKVPVVEFIAFARKHKETIQDLSKVNLYMEMLRDLISAYTTRTDANNPNILGEAKELLSILADEILPIIAKNINNKIAAQVLTNNAAVSSVLEAIKEDQELLQLLKNLLGTDDLEKGIQQENVKSFDALDLLFQEIRSKLDAEQIANVVSRLEAINKKLAAELYATVSEDRKNPALERVVQSNDQYYANNPHTLIGFIVKEIFAKELADPNKAAYEPFHKFLRDLDTNALNLALSSMSKLSEKDRVMLSNIIRIHNKVGGINRALFNISESKLDSRKVVSIKEAAQFPIAPSLQQNIVLQDALNFLSSDRDSNYWYPWFIVNGIGGSGKSHIIGSLLPQIWSKLEGKDINTSVLAFSRQNKTSANIQKQVFGEDRKFNFESFKNLTDEQLDKISLIIIDEIYTFSDAEITKDINSKLVEYHKRRAEAKKPANKIKVIALGDPSQWTAEEIPLFTNPTTKATFRTTIPLTTTFRTNVDSIALFADAFRMKAITVDGAFATASGTPLEIVTSPQDHFGTIALDEEEIIAALKKPSNRTRVLLVSTPNDVTAYKTILPGVEVLTVEQAQGYQWDEVYAILNLAAYGTDPFSINRTLYTAFSRAKSLLAISGLNVNNTIPSLSLSKNVGQEDKLMAQNKYLFDQTLAGANQRLGLNSTTVTQEDFEPVTEEDSEEEMPMTNDVIASPVSFVTVQEPEEVTYAEEAPAASGSRTEHVLRFPTNYNLLPTQVVDELGNLIWRSPVNLNSTGHIIKTTKNKQPFYYVVAPSAVSPGSWVVLGALGDKDFKAQPELASLTSKDVSGLDSILINERAPFTLTPSQLSQSSVSTFNLDSYSRLRTNFRSTYSRDNEQLDAIEQAIINFHATFFGVDESGQMTYPADVYNDQGEVTPEGLKRNWVVNGKVNWSIVKNHVEFVIMTKERLAEAQFSGNLSESGTAPTLGLPYLVIHNPAQKGRTSSTDAKSFYIQFQPIPLQEDSDTLTPIKELRDAVAEIEEIFNLVNQPDMKLGTPEFALLVDMFAKQNFVPSPKNITTKKGQTIIYEVEPIQSITSAADIMGLELSPELSASLDANLIKLVPLTYGAHKQKLIFKTLEEANEYLAENATQNEDKSWTLTSNELSQDTGEPKKFNIVSVQPINSKHPEKNFVLRYARSIEDPTITEIFEQQSVVRGHGTAQHKMNALAMANAAIGEIPFRVTSTKTKGGQTTKLTRSRSILDTNSRLDFKSFLEDPEVIAAGWSNEKLDPKSPAEETTQAIRYLEKRLPGGTQEALALIKKHETRVITLDTLNAIVSEDQFMNGGHISLRTPLHLHTTSWSGVNDIGKFEGGKTKNKYQLDNPTMRRSISSQVMTNFEGMSKTSVAISLELEDAVPQPPKQPGTVKDLLDMIPVTGVPYLDRVADFLRSIPSVHNVDVVFDTQVKLGDETIDLLTAKAKDGSIVDSPAFLTYYDKDTGKVTIVFPTSVDGLKLGSKSLISNVLHEILHAATIVPIGWGQLHLAEGKESKEALFVQRLQAIQKRFHGVLSRNKIKRDSVYAGTRSKKSIDEFIANLSNPVFYEQASKIDATSKTSKSFIRQIIDAIIDLFSEFFSDPAKRNIYEVTFKSLEDLYADTAKVPVPSVPKVVTKKEAAKTLEAAKEQVEAILTKVKNREALTDFIRGILDVKVFIDSGKITYNKLSFERKSEIDKIDILNRLYNNLLGNYNKFQFAYFNRPNVILSATTGAVIETSNLDSAVKQLFPKEILDLLTEEQYNMLYSILHYQLAHAGTSFIENLIELRRQNNVEGLVTELWENILSNKDKKELKEVTEAKKDVDLIKSIISRFEELDITQSFVGIISIIEGEKNAVESIVGTIEDRSPFIYREAKNYIQDIIRANQLTVDSTTQLFQTRTSLFKEIIRNVESVNLEDLANELTNAYSRLSRLRLMPGSKEYQDLIFDEIPKLEHRILGIQALNTVNIKTGRKFVYDIYNEIYPNNPFDKIDEVEIAIEVLEAQDLIYNSYDVLDEELAAAAGISEYIKEYNRSYELTLSESLKDFLATVKVSSSSGDRYLSPQLMYIKLMQLAATLEFSGTDTNTTLERLKTQLDVKLAGELSDVDKATLETLRDTVIRARLKPDVPPTVTLVTGTTASGNVWYVGAVGESDISNLTYEELLGTPGVSRTEKLTDSLVLFTRLQEKYPRLSVFQFNQLIARAEAINTMKGIMNTMVSMKETELYIGTHSIDGGYTTKMQRSKAAGISFSIKETMIESFTDKFNDGTLKSTAAKFNRSMIGGKKAVDIPQNGTPKEKVEYIKRFYEELAGLGRLNVGVSTRPDSLIKLQDYVTQIQLLIGVIENLSDTNVSVAEEVLSNSAEEGEGEKSDLFTSFMGDIDGYLTRFSELATLYSEYLRNPSVRTLKGDKFYKWHESSFAFDVLNTFVDVDKNSIIQGSTGANSYRKIPSHLRSSFYNYNPFVRGVVKNKIYSTGEWEGELNSDNLSNTPYLRETYYYFYNRKFVQGFIDGIKQYKNSYFQYTYIPSDKPKHPLVRVGILSDGEGSPEILKALESAFEQIISSQDWRLNIANFNNSKIEDPFRNFQIGREAVTKYGKSYSELTLADIAKLASIAHQILEEQAAITLRKLVADDVQLKYSFNTNKIISELREKGLLNSKFEASLKELKLGSDFKNPSKADFAGRREEVFKNILPIFDLFYKNNYINNYFLNQLIAGDYAAYKNPADLIKRYAGVFAPGIRGLVDEEVGMKETYRTLVLEDTVIEKATTRERLHKLFFEGISNPTTKQLAEFERVMEFFSESYEMTDAQGFMTPARARQLGRGFERYWYRGAVHKPVHFEVQQQKVRDAEGNYLLDAKGNYITTPIPVYTKYSSIELTDELLSKLEEIGPSLSSLRKLRTNLEKLNVDELLFKSAVKEGAPMYLDEQGNSIKEKGKSLTFAEFINASEEELNTLSRIDNFKNDPSFKGSSPIMELSNRHFRLQFNASTDVHKQVPIYTQLMYFLNVFSNNAQQGVGIHPSLQKEADLTYKLIGELISIGRKDFEAQINTKAKFTKFLKSKFSDANGARALEFLEATISFNNPVVEKKAIIALASGMETSTVRVKFSGAKLVLQSAEGVHYSGYDATGLDETQARELQYRVDVINNRRVMVAEVIVPRALLTKEQVRAITKGESIYMYGDAIGYRIPSTELHSAIPLKVVGLYSPLDKSNVIIAPKELVPIHGSDFDVDALFVITRETFKDSETTVLDVNRLNEYQELLKNFLDTYKELNLEDKYTAQINELQTRLNLFSEEDQDFATQLELDARWADYVTTPNYNPETGTDVVRAEDDDFDAKELYYKKEWGKLNGYKVEKNKETGADNWVVTNKLLAAISELHYAVESAPIEVKELLPKPNLLNFSQSLVGTFDAPVAYTKSIDESGSVRYTFNPNYLVVIRNKITELEKYQDEIYSDLSPLIKPVVISSIKNLKSIQTKAIKNHITETVLSIITDIDSNGARMTTPINFNPIVNAISSLNGKHDKLENLDLSNPEDEYKVFYSLSSGGALVGAFANAVKDFAYLVQAGDSQVNFELFNRNIEVQSKLTDTQGKLELLKLKEKADLTEEESLLINELSTQAANLKLEEVVLRKQLNTARVKSKNSNRAQINPRYRVQIDDELYHALEIRDRKGQFNITETFDTLINSAIDNLKLGYLGQARINTQTGSAIVGGVFMGMPLETLVQIMYQPILRPITTGISSRKDAYMSELRSKYKLKLDNLLPSITQEDLSRGLNLSNDLDKLSEEELLSQLRIFLVFSNLNKIGEDAKHLSSFLSIIRDMQVTVEKLDNLDNIISEHIGTIDLENGILIPKQDFSFVAPNLLANTPHILEAYKTHRAIQDFISNNFLLHSPEMRQLAEKVNYGLGLETNGVTQNSASNLTDIRRAYSHFLLASMIWPNIEKTKPKVINTQTKDGKDVKFSLSKAKTFTDNVANQLLALQTFAKDQGIRNMFLETAYVSKNSVGARSIQFKAGVNLNPEDHQQIAIDFRRLNRFTIDENNKITYDLAITPYSRSPFQEALLHYAVLEYGLTAGSSNYSLYIPPTYIKELDKQYNERLKDTIANIQSKDKNLVEAQLPYFKVLYAMFNANRLGYVPYKDIVKEKFDNFNRLNGVDKQVTIIKDKKQTEVKDVFFDMKVEKKPGARYDTWIKSGFRKIKGYRKVAESLTHVYYQEIGKVSEIFYTPLDASITEYVTSNYFDPGIYTLRHFMKEGNTIYTGVNATHFLKPGDIIYIAPNYDAARQERQLVKIVSIDKLTNAKYPGFKYVVEPTEQIPPTSTEDQEFEKKIKELGIQQICE